MEELVLSCYGVEVRLVDAADAELCQRLRDTVPPEFTASSGPGSAVVSYVVAGDAPSAAKPSAYRVTRDGTEVVAHETEEEVVHWLWQDIDNAVAQRSRQMLFVHAGAVGWRGLAIVVPGRSRTGKSSLVAELVRRGAVYYSDEFAVLDESGSVHPYRTPLVVGHERRHEQDLRLLREEAPTPLPIGLIVTGPYQPGVAWRPTVVRGARTVLPLIDGTILAREESERTLHIAARVAPGVVTLQGPRPEAADVAARLLDLVDDALVSHALGAGERGSRDLTADLSRVAEMRVRARTGQPQPTPRRLLPARHVLMADFLSPAEHRRLLEHTLAHEDDFRESGVTNPQGENTLDYGFRRSRTLWGPRLEEVWDMFDQRLRAMLPAVRRELGLPWFPLGVVERQLTAHGRDGFFAPHVDTGHPVVANRRISCVYYFHPSPRRFTGGDLKLYDTWNMPSGTTPAATFTKLVPVDNSIVFFPSDTCHEVCPVHPETDSFADSRFAVTIWFREGDRPARADDTKAPI
ncbi:MAG TPA: 2OG-Fe(II) oxygenase [Candidatus Methylomirabilis sp.]|nr:2OG-Fe(II) oxygenase [Candidatus Methylomirabilis sp.]